MFVYLILVCYWKSMCGPIITVFKGCIMISLIVLNCLYNNMVHAFVLIELCCYSSRQQKKINHSEALSQKWFLFSCDLEIGVILHMQGTGQNPLQGGETTFAKLFILSQWNGTWCYQQIQWGVFHPFKLLFYNWSILLPLYQVLMLYLCFSHVWDA